MPRTKTDRKKRIPMGGRRLKLAGPERKGYHRHWFNDVGNRVSDALAAGYTFVHDEATLDGTEGNELATRKRQAVGTQESGHPLYAFLMEIPERLYREDQAAKQAEIDETEDAIRRGIAPGQESQTHQYIPSGGISIGRK